MEETFSCEIILCSMYTKLSSYLWQKRIQGAHVDGGQEQLQINGGWIKVETEIQQEQVQSSIYVCIKVCVRIKMKENKGRVSFNHPLVMRNASTLCVRLCICALQSRQKQQPRCHGICRMSGKVWRSQLLLVLAFFPVTSRIPLVSIFPMTQRKWMREDKETCKS